MMRELRPGYDTNLKKSRIFAAKNQNNKEK
jgi:hypothetical protein